MEVEDTGAVLQQHLDLVAGGQLQRRGDGRTIDHHRLAARAVDEHLCSVRGPDRDWVGQGSATGTEGAAWRIGHGRTPAAPCTPRQVTHRSSILHINFCMLAADLLVHNADVAGVVPMGRRRREREQAGRAHHEGRAGDSGGAGSASAGSSSGPAGIAACSVHQQLALQTLASEAPPCAPADEDALLVQRELQLRAPILPCSTREAAGGILAPAQGRTAGGEGVGWGKAATAAQRHRPPQAQAAPSSPPKGRRGHRERSKGVAWLQAARLPPTVQTPTRHPATRLR